MGISRHSATYPDCSPARITAFIVCCSGMLMPSLLREVFKTVSSSPSSFSSCWKSYFRRLKSSWKKGLWRSPVTHFHFEFRSPAPAPAVALASLQQRHWPELRWHLLCGCWLEAAWTWWTQWTLWTRVRPRYPYSELIHRCSDRCRLECWQQEQSLQQEQPQQPSVPEHWLRAQLLPGQSAAEALLSCLSAVLDRWSSVQVWPSRC